MVPTNDEYTALPAKIGISVQVSVNTDTSKIPHPDPLAVYDQWAVVGVKAEAMLEQAPPLQTPPGGLWDPEANEWIIPPKTLNRTGLNADYDIPDPAIQLPFKQVSVKMPRLAATPVLINGRPDPDRYQPTSITRRNVGWMRIAINGYDVTYFRGVPTEIQDLAIEQPFGSVLATLKFPQVTPLEVRGDLYDPWTGMSPQFAEVGYDVDIGLVEETRPGVWEVVEKIWEGYVLKIREVVKNGESATILECQGFLFQADHILAQPTLLPRVEDIGTKIARALNDVPSRRYSYVKKVKTGIDSMARGEWQPTLSGFVSDLLAQATTDTGLDQWTLQAYSGRRVELKKKSSITQTWTVSIGQPGVDIDLSRDIMEEPTHIYGAGIDDKNRGYANLYAPNWTPDSKATPWKIPTYHGPIKVGSTDAQTSGDVTNTRERMTQLGWKMTTKGAFKQSDADKVMLLQADMGLPETGIIDKTTWIAMWEVGRESGRIDDAWYAPFAHEWASQEWIINADGTKRTRNTLNYWLNQGYSRKDALARRYKASIIQMHRYHRFPDGTTKKEAKAAARAELARDSKQGATNNRVGTITLRTCPEEGNRWHIKPGQWIRLMGFHGDGDGAAGRPQMKLRIVSVEFKDNAKTVVLQVDTSSRDALTLDAIKSRNRDAATLARRRSRKASAPSKPIMDAERIGTVPSHSVPRQKWNVVKVPIGFDPTIVWVDWFVDQPKGSAFCLAFFDRPVKAADLNRLVPNPLGWKTLTPSGADTSNNPWVYQDGGRDIHEQILDMGFLDAIGGPGQPAGYWPRKATDFTDDPEADKGGVTGRHQDEVNFKVESLYPPFIWVAEWADLGGTASGEIRIAPESW